VFEHAPYSVVTFLCTSGGICGKLVSPPFWQSTIEPQGWHPDGHVCAVSVCKPASSTRSTGRVTDRPYPAGNTGGQRHISLPYIRKICGYFIWWFWPKRHIIINLASFRFDNSGPWPLNVTSPLRCKRSLRWLIESPVVCDFKLREGLAWPGCYCWGTFPPLPSLECTCCTLRWDRACRADCLQCTSGQRAYPVSNMKFLPGERGITDIAFSGGYTAILKYWYSV